VCEACCCKCVGLLQFISSSHFVSLCHVVSLEVCCCNSVSLSACNSVLLKITGVCVDVCVVVCVLLFCVFVLLCCALSNCKGSRFHDLS
jgi:hypothetical protein